QVTGRPVEQDAVDDGTRRIAGDGEAEPLRLVVAGRAAEGVEEAAKRVLRARAARVRAGAHDRRVDADDLAVEVDERATAVTMVDRGIRLQEVCERGTVVGLLEGTADRADDALGDSVLVGPQRAADGQHRLPGLHAGAIAQL